MRILTRYILREFLKIFTLTLIAFVSIYLVIDIFEQFDRLIEHRVRFGDGFKLFLYKTPFIFYQTSPVAVLMATLISLGIFVRRSEFTAAMAGGISVSCFFIPFFMTALAVSGLNFMLNESIIPLANQKVMAIKETMGGINKRRTQFVQDSVWFRDKMDIYSIDYIEPQKGILKGLTIYKLDNDFNIIKRIDAKEVSWINGKWIAAGGKELSFQQGGLVEEIKMTGNTIPLAEKPEDLINIERLADEMNFRELLRYVNKLKREGYAPVRYLVDLHSKISFPLVSIIMAMIGMPFALKSGRHGGIAVGVGISIIIGFSYWVVFAVNTSLGYNGITPPFLAAWLTNFIFAVLGILMFGYVRQ